MNPINVAGSCVLLLFGLVSCASIKANTENTKADHTVQQVSLPIVALTTEAGTIHLEIDSIRAPLTAANFLRYVDRGLLDGAAFGRTVSPDNEKAFNLTLLQADRPKDASPPNDPPIPLEPTSKTKILHVEGTLSMARGQATQSATSSFFISLKSEPSLDFGGGASGDGQGYGAFGRVIGGLDIIKSIHSGPANGQRLITPVVITSARRVSRS